jgi:hypothetical protein
MKALESQLKHIFLGRSNLNIVTTRGSDATRALRNLEDKSSLSGESSDPNKYIVVYYDCSYGEDLFLKAAEGSLSRFSDKDDIFKQVYDLVHRDFHVTFIFDEFSFKYQEISRYANLLAGIDKERTTMVVVITPTEYFAANLTRYNPNTVLSHNVIFWRHYTDAESLEYCLSLSEKLGVKIPRPEMTKIIDFAGGIFMLLKNLVRSYPNYANFQELIASEEITNAVNVIWNNFTLQEQKALKVVLHREDAKNYWRELQYFKQLGIIDNNDQIRGTWTGRVLNPVKRIVLNAKAGSIYFNQHKIDKFLNKDDVEVLKKLLVRKGKIVTREDVMAIRKTIMPDSEFSNWALDQFISRLRRKLNHLGIPLNYIATIRGSGYLVK